MYRKTHDGFRSGSSISLPISLLLIKFVAAFAGKNIFYISCSCLLKERSARLLLLLSLFYSQFVAAEEQGDFYWQLAYPGGQKNHLSPASACATFLDVMRSADQNNNFDWQLNKIVDRTTPDGIPHASCHLKCAKICSGNAGGAVVYATRYQYKIDTPDNDTPLNSCVGNPINPATGNKYQFEPLIALSGIHAINFNITYNSQRQEKWRHTYSRSVVSVSDVQKPSTVNLNQSFCTGNSFITESAGGFSDAVKESGVVGGGNVFWPRPGKNLPQAARTSARDACELNWTSWIAGGFHYSWVIGSSATYLGDGICSIRDSSNIERMKLNVYRNVSGMQAGLNFSSCADLDPTILPKLDSLSTINVRFTRQDGRLVRYIYNSATTALDNQSNTGEPAELIASGKDITGYRFYNANDEVEVYDGKGRLISITSLDGHVQTLSYTTDAVTGETLLDKVQNASGEFIQFNYETVETVNPFKRIQSVTDHSSRSWGFRYDVNGNLEYVDLPDNTSRQYHYEDVDNIDFLTGITDERGVRYASWTYNSNGKADSSAHGPAKDIDNLVIAYNESNNQHVITKVRNSKLDGSTRNISSTYYTHASGGTKVVAAISGNDDVSSEHNPVTGNLEYEIKYGVKTEYDNYTSSGDPGSITEAAGTPEQRQTTYTYDPRYQRKIATITEASVFPGNLKVTTKRYDNFGNKTSVTIDGFKPDGTAITRTTTFEYNGPFNQLTKIDGPRADVSDIYTIDYYFDDASEGDNRARMKRVTAPLNIVLYDNIAYTETGKMKSYVDANNMQSTLSYYYGNDRLQSLSQLDLNTGDARLTEWTYLATGEIETITRGVDALDKTTLTFNYDDARRLIGIVDGLGNSMEYILDSEGNVEQENVRDAGGILKKQLTQTFDDYNRLQLRTQVNERFTETWSPNGTLDKTVDGKNVITDYSYDSLLRLTQITQDMGGGSPQTADALTILNYDVQDNLTMVTDANGGRTIYVYDDLGNLVSETSPDTGTRTYTYDAAGNVISLLDAKSQLFTYRYDALNRLTNVDAPGVVDDITNIYDACDYGKGLICRVQRNIATLNYSYNAFGDISAIEQSINTWPGYSQAVNRVGYNYDTAGRLKNISYPGGAVVTYSYDAAGNINNVSLSKDGINTALSQNILYQPFGEISSQKYGNGMLVLNFRDQAYRPVISGTPSLYFDYFGSYDANGNPTNGIMLDSGLYLTQSYSFDAHDRLDTSNGLLGDFDYDYDKVGNRTRLLQDGTVTDSRYQPQTNLLEKIADETIFTDANGNTLNLRGMALSYTADNRLKSFGVNATYQYNGIGQRVVKKIKNGVIATTRTYFYGQSGELLAEIGPKGDVFREYIYLNGKPLALLEYTPDSNEGFLAADIDGDGNISIEDYILWYMNYYIAGDISKGINADGVLDNTDTGILVNCALTPASCRAASYNTAIYYVHNDHLGTPKVLTNETGQPVWRALADPFGKATVDEDVDGDGQNVVMNFRFPGQYYDAETQLHYNYFRDYDPSIGRYITADPLGVIGRSNDPQLVMLGFQDKGWFEFEGEIYYDNQFTAPEDLNHLYGYAGNNPLRNIDIYGLWYYGGGTGSLGDYFSGPNGNVSPGFTKQDYVCSSVACVLNPFPPMLERCIGHDKCYEKNRCNSSSWISNALGGTKSCNQCNSNF